MIYKSAIERLKGVKSIDVNNAKYIIHTVDRVNEGFLFFGYGYVYSYNSHIVVCSEKQSEDYITIQKWIDKITLSHSS
jgi:hypothetical protein